MGFDGFVDAIIHLVDKRHTVDSFDRIPTIKDYGQRIIDAAGLSCNIEMVVTQTKLGGNGPIMGNALVAQGYPTHYIGAIGNNRIHPVFQDFAEQCESVISLTAPANSDALEFDDGKIIMGKMTTLEAVNWSNIKEQLPEPKRLELLKSVAMIACTNWTMLPQMNSVLLGLNEDLAKFDERPYIFVDLADPKKRSESDIAEVLSILGKVQKNAEVVLGLNESESAQIENVLLGDNVDDLRERATRIREKLNLHLVVIHPTKSAACASAEGAWFLEGPFTTKPKLTTGAGDNFNAGFCNGLLSGCSPEESLAVGVCSSGFYVRQCRSGNRKEIKDFMQRWADIDCGTMP